MLLKLLPRQRNNLFFTRYKNNPSNNLAGYFFAFYTGI